ncbi:MAG: CpaD family pilus assembly protein [Aestuariivirga sp.]|uniref:CpaD family pilus assembly protein n=1 Tax=Aestuariivirga sp. TaxID=2650926 RepID=UPI0038D1AE13
MNAKLDMRAAPRQALMAVALAAAVLAAGCSQDQAGFEDVYTPASAAERFPIDVVERPVGLKVAAGHGKLSASDANLVANLAAVANRPASSAVTISYPAESRYGRKVAGQAAAILAREGVPRARIRTAAYNGKADTVTLGLVTRVAATKPCGDWSENLANNFANKPYPNMGCAMQNNLAAMISNPEDLVRPRGMPPAQSAARAKPMENYQTNEWTKPTATFGDVNMAD